MTKQSYYVLLSDFQIRQNEAWVLPYHKLTTICSCTKGIRELLNICNRQFQDKNDLRGVLL